MEMDSQFLVFLWKLSGTAETPKLKVVTGSYHNTSPAINLSTWTTLKQMCSNWLISLLQSVIFFFLTLLFLSQLWQSRFNLSIHLIRGYRFAYLCLWHSPAPCDFSFVTSGIVLGLGPVVLYLHGTELKHGSVNKCVHPHPKVWSYVFVWLPQTSVTCMRVLHVISLSDPHQCLCAMTWVSSVPISSVTSCLIAFHCLQNLIYCNCC